MVDISSNFDTSSICAAEKWMDMMGIFVPPDVIERSETAQAIFSVLINRVRPKEVVKRAKRILLYQKLTMGTGEDDNQEPDKEIELRKKSFKLKEQIKLKEIQFAEKKQIYQNLVTKCKEMIQNMQLLDCALNEETKKIYFLSLNKKALDNTLESYSSLRHTVSEVQDVQKRNRKMPAEGLDTNIFEVVNECVEHVVKTRNNLKEQQDNLEYMSGGNGHHEGAIINSTSIYSTTAMKKKTEMLEYVSKKLKAFPRCAVYEVLFVLQQELIDSINSLLKKESFAELRKAEVILENGEETSYKKLSFKTSDLTEEFKVVEDHFVEIKECIQERVSECKNVKSQLKVNMKKMCKIMSSINCYFSQLHQSKTEDTDLDLELSELYKSMEQLCTLGPTEINIFAQMPLIALEKLTLPNEESVPGYELSSNYMKVIACIAKCRVTRFSGMNEATSLNPYDLLLHMWQQLIYHGALLKTTSLIKPETIDETDVDSKLDIVVENYNEIKEKHNQFLTSFATYESVVNSASDLVKYRRFHPLAEVIPRDRLVDGLSINEFMDALRKNENNEKCDNDLEDPLLHDIEDPVQHH